MRNLSTAFKQLLANDNRSYLGYCDITFTDGTTITADSAVIWANGFSLDSACSSETAFTALGSVVVDACTITLNNIDDIFSAYDFTDAKIVFYVVLNVNGTEERIKMCSQTVDKATYNGALIRLSCLSNLSKLDRPYSDSSLVYPATLQQIVNDACTVCGITLGTTTFPHYNYTITTKPEDSSITFREVLSWVAAIAGTFVSCNSNGDLVLNWFDTDTLSTEFENPTYTNNSIHYIRSLSSQTISTNRITITGVQAEVKVADTENNQSLVYYTSGTDGYLIKLVNNGFINSTNAQEIVNWLGTLLIGVEFNVASISHLNDPSIEVGDVALIIDRKNNISPILITNTIFNIQGYQSTKCSAEEPVKNTATRYTESTKAFVETKNMVQQEKTAREQMGEDLETALAAKAGMYETRVQEAGGGYTYYMHDKPLLTNSTAVIKITNEAVGITPNYQASPIQWYGLTVDGNFIANIMSVIGIDFDWGTGGTLVLGGQNNVNGSLTIKDADNNTIGYWDNTGINAIAGTIGGYTIANNELYTTFEYNGVTYRCGIRPVQYLGPIFTHSVFYVSRSDGAGYFTVQSDCSLSVYEGTLGAIRFIGNRLGAYSTQGLLNTDDYVYIRDNGDTDRSLVFGAGYNVSAWANKRYITGEISGRSAKFFCFTDPSVEISFSEKDISYSDDPSWVPPAEYALIGKMTFGIVDEATSALKYGVDLSVDYQHGHEGFLSITNKDSSLLTGISFDLNPVLSEVDSSTLGVNAGLHYADLKLFGNLYASDGTNNYTILNENNIEYYALPLTGGTLTGLLTETSNIHLRVPVTKGTAPSASVARYIDFYDTGTGTAVAANRLGYLGFTYTNGNSSQLSLVVYNPDPTSTDMEYLMLGYPKNSATPTMIYTGPYAAFGRVASTVATEFHVRNSLANVCVYVTAAGAAGLYSSTAGKIGWIIYMPENDTNAIIPRPLQVTGTVTARDYTGDSRVLVSSYNLDGRRVATFGAVDTQTLYVMGQWGTTGSTYTAKAFTTSTSDVRLKEGITDSKLDALSLINQIRIREFDWIGGQHQPIGMIADEIEQLDPLLAVGGGEDEDGNVVYKSVNTFYLVGYLVKAVQELSEEIKKLKGEK